MDENFVNALGNGENRLVNQEQLRFIQQVNNDVQNYIRRVGGEENVQRNLGNAVNPPFFEQIRVTEENYTRIFDVARRGREAYRNAHAVLPNLLNVRRNHTNVLDEISKSINSDRFASNCVKATGYSAAAVGGVLALTSRFIFKTDAAAALAQKCGAGLGAAGGVAAFGATGVEFLALKEKVARAQAIWRRDRELFGPLRNWLNCSVELEIAIANLEGINVTNDLRRAIDAIRNDVQQMVANVIQRGMRYDNVMLNGIFHAAGIETEAVAGFQEMAADYIPMVGALIVLLTAYYVVLKNRENRFVFDGAIFTVRSVLDIVSAGNQGTDIIVRLLGGAATQELIRNTLALFGTALNLAGAALAAFDIYKGSESPEAQKIAIASHEMKKEARIFQRLYDEMEKHNI